jgi:hypothetical protein
MAMDVVGLLKELEGRIQPGAEPLVYEFAFVGDERRFVLDLRKTSERISEGVDAQACRLGWHPEDLLDFLGGKVQLGTLFSSGRLRVFSRAADAMKLETLVRNP